MINRVKQFTVALFARLDKYDKEFINKYLNNKEKNIFNKLSSYEQKHSINVAKYCLVLINECNNNIDETALIKAALLHDIGKIKVKLNIFDRSILVILNKLTKGKLRNFKHKKVHIYYNHGEEGYKLLKNYGYSEEFLSLIRYHHNFSEKLIKSNKELQILVQADNEN